jgi:hypothetical protein
MWLDIAKGALLLFVVGGAVYFVVTYVRKSRGSKINNYDPNGYMAFLKAPPLQPPEWVNWTDDEEGGGIGEGTDRSRR